uniref:Pentatricopeptide repeat-containing protein n=1 Tax=Tanacetum cinerariifolium TaxID=118510 RepID=A0A6L2NC07_TANCI|nr:pentatricopeptide repeat-containing protein [Tanacetum cinerariifolium]
MLVKMHQMLLITRCIVEVDSKTEYESDDDSDYQSDKSVEYLSPGEDELIKLRNRMKANRKAKAKEKDKPDEEINAPNEENSMPTDNVRGETFEEHDIYMNEWLKSIKTTNKDGITEDPFISVEKHVERYPMYDETTHWRLRKPKAVNEQLEAEVLTRSFHSSRTSYVVAADLFEMELKKILIEKMEGNKSIQRSDE